MEGSTNEGTDNTDSGYPGDEMWMKPTAVAGDRNDKWKGVCSEIVDGFIYLGADFVAKNKDVLLENSITHVINCSADYSPNYHTDLFTYKKYHLKDHPQENIECIFYDAISFIEECKR